MLRRLSDAFANGTVTEPANGPLHSSSLEGARGVKVLYHIQGQVNPVSPRTPCPSPALAVLTPLGSFTVLSIQLEKSTLVTKDSLVSACFVTDGKLSVTPDQQLIQDENSSLFFAQMNDRLSLLIQIPFQQKKKDIEKAYEVHVSSPSSLLPRPSPLLPMLFLHLF
jgi:hypothetical protein